MPSKARSFQRRAGSFGATHLYHNISADICRLTDRKRGQKIKIQVIEESQRRSPLPKTDQSF